jgi:cation transport regulator ChaC
MTRAVADTEAMQRRVHEMYDYDAVIAKAPDPREVEWVFGYGSIVFRHGFDCGHCVSGCIPGWKRTFYQLSTGAFTLMC